MELFSRRVWINFLGLLPGSLVTVLAIAVAFLRFYDRQDFQFLSKETARLRYETARLREQNAKLDAIDRKYATAEPSSNTRSTPANPTAES